MNKRRSGSTIVGAASGGFLAGAIAVAILVWGFPNVARSVGPNAEHPAGPPLAADQRRPAATQGEGSPGVIESHPSALASPPPVIEPPVPSPTATPVIEADPIAELRDRQLDLPVRAMVRRELRNSFDQMRGSTHTHEAIDILAPRNTPILAVENGTVARLFESKAGGITVYQFDPTTRYVYYYAHLERYADELREGAHVQRGQVLGYVGTSGNAPKDTPHLHFAIFRLTEKKQWWQGRPINPYDVLK
jgi:murein DD-endopeptidase MepM/ murein hydrolase activator NlpD